MGNLNPDMARLAGLQTDLLHMVERGEITLDAIEQFICSCRKGNPSFSNPAKKEVKDRLKSKIDFTKRVVDRFRQLQSNYTVDFLNPLEITVNGQRFDLENLHRMVESDPSEEDQVVLLYLKRMLSAESVEMGTMTFDFARTRIMPRIHPISIFEHLVPDQMAHVPYVNDTVILFVTDLPDMTVSITTEQIVRWRISIEAVEEIARENLKTYKTELEAKMVESREGGCATIIMENDGYDAARLLLDGLHGRFSEVLGQDFYVAVPARDMFVAFSRGPAPFVNSLRERVATDFKRLPYPITPEFFLVTRDGVAGTKDVEASSG